MEPRVIRAKWEVETISKDDSKAIYRLNAGRVPSVLRVNQESRAETRKQYKLINSHITLQGKTYRDERVYINFSIDTLYIYNIPDTTGFLSWFRSLSFKMGDHYLLNLAISSSALSLLYRTGATMFSKPHPIHSIFMTHPKLETLTAVFDHSKFRESRSTNCYSLVKLKTRDGCLAVHVNIVRIEVKIEEFMSGRERFDQLKKFRESHPDWEGPSVQAMSILKVR